MYCTINITTVYNSTVSHGRERGGGRREEGVGREKKGGGRRETGGGRRE